MTVRVGLGPSPRRGQGGRGQAGETTLLSGRAERTFGECQQPLSACTARERDLSITGRSSQSRPITAPRNFSLWSHPLWGLTEPPYVVKAEPVIDHFSMLIKAPGASLWGH